MLAKPLPDNFQPQQGDFCAEEKFDGHRLMVRVSARVISSWSRTGKDSEHKLSPMLQQALKALPDGVYDGELITMAEEGSKSYDVANLDTFNSRRYVVFDCLENAQHESITSLQQKERRAYLLKVFEAGINAQYVVLANAWEVYSAAQLEELCNRIWDNFGEGLIVKNRRAPYRPGKRSDAYMKLKECGTAVLTITGFAPSEGEKVNRGPCGITLLRDDEGHDARVKTPDDATCARMEAGQNGDTNVHVGRRLRIEYHQRTPDGSYRSPRWDRFEDE